MPSRIIYEGSIIETKTDRNLTEERLAHLRELIGR
jgi:hypothetical protein